MRKFRPFSLAFGVAALLTVALYGAVWAQAQSPAQPATQPEPEPSAYLTLDMAAGFALDPFLVSLNGGGEVAASSLDDQCAGYVNDKPVLTARWHGAADELKVFFYSDSDSSLVIQQPDGKYVCADDFDPNVLDAQLTLTQPVTGTYKLWIGASDANQLIPGLLVITAQPDVSLATFDPSKLVKRPPLPDLQAPDAAAERKAKEVITETAPAEVNGVITAETTLTASVNVTGTTPAFQLGGEQSVCSGIVGDKPDFVFAVKPGAEHVRVFFDGNEDTALAIVSAAAEPLCADDSADGQNANPVIDVVNPEPGNYAVYVGRFSDSGEITGTLTVTTDPNAEPAILAPVQ